MDTIFVLLLATFGIYLTMVSVGILSIISIVWTLWFAFKEFKHLN